MNTDENDENSWDDIEAGTQSITEHVTTPLEIKNKHAKSGESTRFPFDTDDIQYKFYTASPKALASTSNCTDVRDIFAQAYENYDEDISEKDELSKSNGNSDLLSRSDSASHSGEGYEVDAGDSSASTSVIFPLISVNCMSIGDESDDAYSGSRSFVSTSE